MNKKHYIIIITTLLTLGLGSLLLAVYGYVNADATGYDGELAIRSLLIFGGALISISVVLYALFIGNE